MFFYLVISTKVTRTKPPNEDRILPFSYFLTSKNILLVVIVQLNFVHEAIVFFYLNKYMKQLLKSILKRKVTI